MDKKDFKPGVLLSLLLLVIKFVNTVGGNFRFAELAQALVTNEVIGPLNVNKMSILT
jgi:hypothetical protein